MLELLTVCIHSFVTTVEARFHERKCIAFLLDGIFKTTIIRFTEPSRLPFRPGPHTDDSTTANANTNVGVSSVRPSFE